MIGCFPRRRLQIETGMALKVVDLPLRIDDDGIRCVAVANHFVNAISEAMVHRRCGYLRFGKCAGNVCAPSRKPIELLRTGSSRKDSMFLVYRCEEIRRRGRNAFSTSEEE